MRGDMPAPAERRFVDREPDPAIDHFAGRGMAPDAEGRR